MSRWVLAVVVGFVLIVLCGLVVIAIQRARLNANLAASRNNLRQLALFAAHHSDPAADKKLNLPAEVPPATVVLPGVAPENRLSWVVKVLPGLDRTRNPVEAVAAELDPAQPWSAERNQNAGRMKLGALVCPEAPPESAPNGPALTSYVGVAGLGDDAATIALPPTGPAPPRAGAFRYDGPTPFDRIVDGLGQVILMGETANEPGPWLQGGRSTTRGVDDGPNARPLIGWGAQFGGYFPTGGNFAMCDGSVRMISPQITPDVFHKLATIAGAQVHPPE